VNTHRDPVPDAVLARMERTEGFPLLRDAFEKAINDKVAKDLMPTEKAESDLLPLVLFRGRKTLGEMQGLWNVARGLMIANVGSWLDAEMLAYSCPEAVHTCGLHPNGETVSALGVAAGRLQSFASRLRSAPSVQAIQPDLWEYIDWLSHNAGGWRACITLAPIPRWSPWSTLKWRRPVRPRVYRPLGPRFDEPAVPEVWPFLSEHAEATDGAVLVRLVDEAVPKTLPEIVRQEVCQDLLLGIVASEFPAAALGDRAFVAQQVSLVLRRYPIKYGPLSLDAPPPWDKSGPPLSSLLAAPADDDGDRERALVPGLASPPDEAVAPE
jgi:hypothetical protein